MPKSIYVDPNEMRQPGYIKFTDIPVNQYNKTIEEEKSKYSKEDFLRIYEDMFSIRTFELMLNDIKTKSEYEGIPCSYKGPAHLSTGQEAVAVGEAYHLTIDDFTFGSHRSHNEIIAKGFSAIHKLSDEELVKIMENFLGGHIYQFVKEHIEYTDIKDLARKFFLYSAMAEIFARDRKSVV